MDVSVGWETSGETTHTDADFTPSGGETLTILVDLSRMLRFYNGMGYPDHPNKAYFFAHTNNASNEAIFTLRLQVP